jgi:hypothetical protein
MQFTAPTEMHDPSTTPKVYLPCEYLPCQRQHINKKEQWIARDLRGNKLN